MAVIGDTAYPWEDLSTHATEFNDTIALLTEECRVRDITLLAGTVDPEAINSYASVYEVAVMRVLDPNMTWRPDFDFRAMTYREYKKKTKYRQQLLRYILRGDGSLAHATRFASSRVIS
jgi:hypothetical protein